MWIMNLLKSLLSTSAHSRGVCQRSPARRLCLEALEDRLTPSYTVVDLGTLGGNYSEAADLNSSAHVVGTSRLGDGSDRAFLWQDGVMTNLGTLGGIMSRAHGINDLGQVVGMSNLAGDAYAYRAFLLTPEDTNSDGTPDRWFRDSNGDGANDLMQNLGTLGGAEATSVALDVNNLGQVIGSASWRLSIGWSYTSRSFLWQSGVMTLLDTSGELGARAINDAGVIMCLNYSSQGESHVSLWKDGSITDLGISDIGNDINSAGQIVDSLWGVARLWTPTTPNATTGMFTSLGVLPPSQPWLTSGSVAHGINNLGQVVGNSNEQDPMVEGHSSPRAFVWSNGVMEQLPVDVALDINDAGQIVGTSGSRSYLLIPVAPGTPRLTITGGSITEGDSGTADLVFTVRLSLPSANPVSVQYTTSNGTASAGSDYQADTGTLTFAPGETEREIRIAVIGERIGDAGVNESFAVRLSNASGAFIETDLGVGGIIDNEPRIVVNDVSVVEGNAGSVTAIMRLVLTNSYDQPVTVGYSTADVLNEYEYAAATAGSDYVPVSGTAEFQPGDTVFEVPITVLGDRIAESFRNPYGYWQSNSEQITLELTNPSSNVALKSVGMVTIEDDEPRVSISPYVSVMEGDPTAPTAVFTVSLSAPYEEDVIVHYTTYDVNDPYNRATPGSDYVVTSGSVRFVEGETEQRIEVPIIDDTDVESPEFFYVFLDGRSSNVDFEGENSLALAEIVDSEPPAIAIGDVSRLEGNTGTTTFTFTVTLSYASLLTLSVDYATASGTASAGSDYQAASGTLTFAPGETNKTIAVPVIGDRLGESNETFVVNLSSPTNANIADGQGIGTILDDEPRVSISDVTKQEGKRGKTTLFVFTVTLSAAYDQPVTMSFRTVNGTATTGDGDYLARTGTLTLAPGETTKTITIEVKGDSKKEASETFYLDLFDLSSNAQFTKSRGIGTVLNDE